MTDKIFKTYAEFSIKDCEGNCCEITCLKCSWDESRKYPIQRIREAISILEKAPFPGEYDSLDLMKQAKNILKEIAE
jgi:hypothetical protein